MKRRPAQHFCYISDLDRLLWVRSLRLRARSVWLRTLRRIVAPVPAPANVLILPKIYPPTRSSIHPLQPPTHPHMPALTNCCPRQHPGRDVCLSCWWCNPIPFVAILFARQAVMQEVGVDITSHTSDFLHDFKPSHFDAVVSMCG